MNTSTVSTTARRRIRNFSVWIWLWGALVLFVGTLNTFEDVRWGDDGLVMVNGDENAQDGDDSPWDLEDPPVFEADGTTYSGDGDGLIRIPFEDHDQDPYAATMLADGYVNFNVTPAADINRPSGENFYPPGVGYIYDRDDTMYIIPPDADLELWVAADGPWEFDLAKAEVVEITGGFAQGTGDEFLVYRGDAVSAQFEHTGTGLFDVTIQTTGSWADTPIIDHGEVDERLAWDPTDAVYFTIDSDPDRGAWSIDIDELAKDERP